MTERIRRLRARSLRAVPALSSERGVLLTRYYRSGAADGLSVPRQRSGAFAYLMNRKKIAILPGELIVGERGPAAKATPSYPEITCHSLRDLDVLDRREKTRFRVSAATRRDFAGEIIPFWRGRTMREKLFALMEPEWLDAYEAGVFTEFMEQRAPGHTVCGEKIYEKGLLDLQAETRAALQALDFLNDPLALARREELLAMEEAAGAVIAFARRYAARARQLAKREKNASRRRELRRIAVVCEHVPAHAPRDFHEALQAYWFCHQAVITELNGWDSFSPGHLDQHLLPFYRKGLADGTLTEESARELLECFFIKFNNHPAPPKVGVTAEESGTYTDFANINLAGLLADGSDGSNEITHILLDIIDQMHLLQPSSNLQLSRKTPDAVLHHALRVIRKGYGFPSIFNADAVVQEHVRMGKSLEDARTGGCSGCVEAGVFGKEAYILTGYFNLPKVLELTLNGGRDPRTGKQLGLAGPGQFETFEDLEAAFGRQFRHILRIKLEGNAVIERMYATMMPAPFLSAITDDCIANGADYNAGGARYNNSYVQFVGIGSLTDSLAALRQVVYEEKRQGLDSLREALAADFASQEPLRQFLVNRTHKYGNDDDYADSIMRRVFAMLFEELDGVPNGKGGCYRVEMLPTTCHVYFGSVTGAMPDGRRAGLPLSEGISPVQGADRMGPTAVMKSAAKMDHLKTGGTLLNMKFTPSLLEGEGGIEKLAHLVRGYFKMDAHHVQFNVVRADTLRRAQAQPEAYRDLIVRVAGYSDYFCDLSAELQEEIITRTEHQALGAASGE